MNRFKNIGVLFMLTLFLIFVKFIPVTCLIKTVTGIYCPACGMTRAFNHIIHFEFIDAFFQNILSIPLFVFIVVSIIMLLIDIIKNKFDYIPKLLNFFEKYYVFIIILIVTSFIYNNLFSSLLI